MGKVDGSRVVVVGASSGLGRAVGVGLGRSGARVALLARRGDRVAAAAEEAGGSAVGIACDVREEDSCRRAIDEATAELGGGIDALLYFAAVGPLGRLADAGADLWGAVLETNVVGAALTTQAAIGHLEASGGRAVYLSSMSASLTPPWPGLGAYSVSKAALDKLVEAWQVEHPAVRFTRLVVGNTAGGAGPNATEFAAGWDPELAAACFATWQRLGYLDGALVTVENVLEVVATILRSDGTMSPVVVRGAPG